MHKRMLVLCSFVLLLVLLVSGCSKNDETAPDGMKALENEVVDYTLYIPKEWTEDISTGVLTAKAADKSNISMTAFNLESSSTTLDEYWASYEESFKVTFPDMEYVEQSDTVMGAMKAKKKVYTATVTGIPYQFMQVVTIQKGMVYVLTYTATPELYDSHIEAVQSVIDNFSFK